MSWVVLAITASILDSLRIFIDNFASDTYFKGIGAVSQKLFYAFVFIAMAILSCAILWEDLPAIPIWNIIIIVVSGIVSSVSGIFYYRVLEIDDSNNLAILIQLAPLLYLIYDWMTGASFSPFQLISFATILAAPLLIILSSRKNSRKTKIKATIIAFLYVLVATIGNLMFVSANSSEFNFVLVMAFAFLGKGIGNLIIIYTRPKLRKRFWSVARKSRGKLFKPLILNSIVGLVKDFVYRGALITAPAVALGSVVSDSSEPVVAFLLGIILTLVWPKFGREKLDRRNVLIRLASTILVLIGIIILQVS